MKQLVIILLFLPMIGFGQGWEINLGIPATPDFGRSVKQTTDGGYIITGMNWNQSMSRYECFLMKTNENGSQQWVQTFGEGTDPSLGYCVQQTNDGGYIIAGADYAIDVIKTDENGVEQWRRIYESINCFSVQQTNDGGYVLAGTGTVAGSNSSFLIKINEFGEELWVQSFDLSISSDWAFSVAITNDGGYILTGVFFLDPNSYDIFLIKTNENGTQQWIKTFGGDEADWAHSVKQTDDGGYIITGYSSSYNGNDFNDVWLLKTDENGIEEWSTTFETGNGYAVEQTNEGGYIVVGTKNGNVFLIKTNENGSQQWSRTFEGGSVGWSIEQTNDNGYIITGDYQNWVNNNADLFLIKTDSNGCIYSSTSSETHIVCDSFEWNGITYSESGSYTYTTTNSLGCDSIATLNLEVNNSSETFEEITVCDVYNWNGTNYTESGTYTFDSTNEYGCTHTSILFLTIQESNSYEESVIACDSYHWNGVTYYESNSYTYQTVNNNGCDSIVTLNLVINSNETTIDTQEHCDSYTWIDGNTYTESNNSSSYLFDGLETLNGCDSLVILNLIINESPLPQNIIGQTNAEPFSTYLYSLEANDNSYTWNVTNGNIITNNNNSVEVLWGDFSEGSIVATEFNNNNCNSTNLLEVNIFEPVNGCMDILACNYNDQATNDSGNCIYLDGICETCENGNIVDNDLDNDGVCNEDEVIGCMDEFACNYNSQATDEPIAGDIGECTYVTDDLCETCVDGVILFSDQDSDGICDAYEIAGCTDTLACNYNSEATDENDSCEYIDGICDWCDTATGTIIDNDSDNDGICDDDEIATYNCMNSVCIDPGDNTGEYISLGECETICLSIKDTWDCVDNFCVGLNDGTGLFNTLEGCAEFCNTTFIKELNKSTKKLKKITNLLGQEMPIRMNTPMLYIYYDGSVEKKIIFD